MAEQVKDPTVPKDKRTLQQKHFDEMYAAFYAFYQAELRDMSAPHEKVRLMLTTHFFDDIELKKLVDPIFAKYSTNVEEKRAVARAAYFDALLVHKLSRFNDGITTQLFKNDEDLEKTVNGVRSRVEALEKKVLVAAPAQKENNA